MIQNCLEIRLGDGDLAADAYTDLREQVIRAKERWHDLDVSVTLSPWTKGRPRAPAQCSSPPCAASTELLPPTPRCGSPVCPTWTSTASCFRIRQLPRPGTSSPSLAWTPAAPEAFELLQFNVDGTARPARRTTRAGSQIYTVNLGNRAGGGPAQVAVAYTYRALIQRNGHLFYLDIARPTKNLNVQFAYGDCGIRYANVLDYIASSRQPRISRLPASDPTPSIEIGFDGWIFPKAGVAMVWTLEEEMTAAGR